MIIKRSPEDVGVFYRDNERAIVRIVEKLIDVLSKMVK